MECNLCLRTTIQDSFQKGCLRNLSRIETVCFFITQEHLCSRFLYYFCLCKSFKELFLNVRSQERFLLSGCKGTTIFDTLQIFRRLFSIFNKSFRDY